MKTLQRRLRDGQSSIIFVNQNFDTVSLVSKAIKSYKNEEEISLIHIDLRQVTSFFEAATDLINNYVLSDDALSLLNSEFMSGGSYFLKLIQFHLLREQLDGKRVLLFINEFQKLSTFEDMEVSEGDINNFGKRLTPGKVFLKRLRSLLQSQQHSFFIASGSDVSILNLFSEYHEPFFKAAIQLKIDVNEELKHLSPL
ncbi:MAG: hypothetical protein AB7C96_11885 [Hydrogenovibrio sp.]